MPRSLLRVLVAVLLLAPSAWQAWVERDMPHFGFSHDDGLYYVGAKSLADGQGYRILSLPGQPPQTKYPPLLSFGLSLVWRIAPSFPANLAVATLFAWLWFPVWLALVYRMLRDLGLEPGASVAVCAGVALNQHVVHFAMRTQPELLFATLWTASASLTMRRRMPAVAGALAGLAYLAKTAALPMLAVAPLCYMIRRRYRAAATFAAAMFPMMAAWNLWARAHTAPTTDVLRMYYVDYFGYHLRMVTLAGYPGMVLKNVDALLTSLGGLLLGWASEPGTAERVAGALMLIGTIRHFRRVGLNPYHLFAAGYTVLLLVWHYPPDQRFLVPVVPLFLAGLWTECRLLYGMLARPRRLPALAFAGACVVFLLYWNVAGWSRFSAYGADLRYVRDRCHRPAYDWIAQHTPADARFLAAEDALLYLYTGRTAMTAIVPMRFFYEGNTEAAVQMVRSRPALARERGLGYIFDAPRDWWRELLPNSRALSRESSEGLKRSPEARRVYAAEGCSVYELAP